MWTLIITVVILSQFDGSANSTSITSVNGFSTEAVCRAGGQAWYDENIKNIRGLKRVTFTCVKQ